MTIQHSQIPDIYLHEPKGAAGAVVNTVYVSDGLGSGSWKKVPNLSLQGVSSAPAGYKAVSDGAGGFLFVADSVYGSMTITANTNSFSVTAAADSTLNTNTDYVLLTGTGAPWAGEQLNGVTFNTNRLTVPTTGTYRIDLWSTITGYPTNTAKVSVKYRVNGTTFSSRHPLSKSNSAGDAGQLQGFGLFPLTAGDFIQIYVASSATGGLIFADLNTTLSLEKAA